MKIKKLIIPTTLLCCLMLFFFPQASGAVKVKVGTCDCAGKLSGFLVDEPACTKCEGTILGLALSAANKQICVDFVNAANCTWADPNCDCTYSKTDVKEADCNTSILPKIPGVTVSATCTLTNVKEVEETVAPAGAAVGGTGSATLPSGGATVPAPALSGPSAEQAVKDAIAKVDSTFPGEMVKTDDVSVLAGNAVSLLLGIIGSIALIVFIYSGIMWTTAMGESKKIDTAEKSMIWAALGLFVIFISYIIVGYIIGNLDFWG